MKKLYGTADVRPSFELIIRIRIIHESFVALISELAKTVEVPQKMASTTAVLRMDEKAAKLLHCGSGYRSMDDPFFEANNTVIFKPFVRLGVYRYDDESLCHKS